MHGVEIETAEGVDGVGVVFLIGDGVFAIGLEVLQIGEKVACHLVHEELLVDAEVFIILRLLGEGASLGTRHEVEGVLIGHLFGGARFGIHDDGIAKAWRRGAVVIAHQLVFHVDGLDAVVGLVVATGDGVVRDGGVYLCPVF